MTSREQIWNQRWLRSATILPNFSFLSTHGGFDVGRLPPVAEEFLFDAPEQFPLLPRVVAFRAILIDIFLFLVVVVGVVEEGSFLGILGFIVIGVFGGDGVGRRALGAVGGGCGVVHGGMAVFCILDLPLTNAFQNLIRVVGIAQRKEPGGNESNENGSKCDAARKNVKGFFVENILKSGNFALGHREEFLSSFMLLFRFGLHGMSFFVAGPSCTCRRHAWR